MLSLISVRNGHRARRRGPRGVLGAAAAAALALLLVAPSAQAGSIGFDGFPSFDRDDRDDRNGWLDRSWKDLLELGKNDRKRDRDWKFPDFSHGDRGHDRGHGWDFDLDHDFELGDWKKKWKKHWRHAKKDHDEPGKPIPEPGAALLFAAGAGAVAFRLRRR